MLNTATNTAPQWVPFFSKKENVTTLCRVMGVAETKGREIVRLPDFPKPVQFGSVRRWNLEEVSNWLKTQQAR